jgi:hypothetical protein
MVLGAFTQSWIGLRGILDLRKEKEVFGDATAIEGKKVSL